MGRYAYFSSGYEYKFAFAVQPSSDITELCGVETGWNKVSWSKDNQPCILEILKEIEVQYCIPSIDFTKYTNNLDGTYELNSDFRDHASIGLDIHWIYRLGAIIYHQLCYNDKLSVEYER